MNKNILLLCLLLLLCSCVSSREHGYYFIDKNKVESFDVYNFTKQDLIDNVGLPSIELDKNVWLYYSYTKTGFRFLKPKINSETIVIVYFDAKDNIVNFNVTKRSNTKNIKTNVSDAAINKTDVNSIKEKNKTLLRIFDGVVISPIQQ
ncbi:MAG: hypothetical protein IJ853_04310 [Rickettsiales bacterium]|nr:hypothetical protein [Rickettsiales bacterium]